MKFAVVNLGCKVNRVESDGFVAALLARGGVVASEDEAELIVINTCTVTGEAEKKTRKAVRRALRVNPGAPVVVTGCAVVIDAAFYEGLDVRVQTLSKDKLLAAIEQGIWDGSGEPASKLTRNALRTGEDFRTRAAVKVQDGCDNACTYCIVHVARGRATSRLANEIVSECADYARAGVKEIVLTGINLGSYGKGARGHTEGVRLPDLLRQLLAVTADMHKAGEPPTRFRLSSIEPCDVTEDLVDLLATSQGRLCRHVHLPLQSGSTKVLREMARPYDADRYRALVNHLYEKVPSLSLSTDIIVGFPGETEGEFNDTLALAKACRFAKIHVFPYSQRAGTPAAARSDQVVPKIRALRATQLRVVGDELRASEFAQRIGIRELGIVERGGFALTESYYEVPAPTGACVGSLVPLELTRQFSTERQD